MNKDLLLLLECAITEHGIKSVFEHLGEAVSNVADKPLVLSSGERVTRLKIDRDNMNRIAGEITVCGDRIELIYLGAI